MAPGSGTGLSMGIFYRDLLQPGGLPRETALLAGEMSKLVDQLALYCYVREASRAGVSELNGIPVKAFYQPGWRRNRDPIWAATGIGDVVRNNKNALSVLVLIGGFIPENAPIARAARRVGIPYVLSAGAAFNPHLFFGAKGLKKRLYERLFERRVVEGAIAIRLYSEAQISHLAARGYADKGRFFVAKEGIDWEDIRSEGAMTAGRSAREEADLVTFGFLGRLDVTGKGLDVLLEAWSLFEHGGGNGRLLIAGPATQRESARMDRLMELFGSPSVTLQPAMYGRDKYEFLRSLSYLVLPSRHEGIPRVLREALAVGCPVIVTEDTNLHDVVAQHVAGAIVRCDARDLARTLADLARKPEMRRNYSDGAYRAAESLTWESAARALVEGMTNRLAHHP